MDLAGGPWMWLVARVSGRWSVDVAGGPWEWLVVPACGWWSMDVTGGLWEWLVVRGSGWWSAEVAGGPWTWLVVRGSGWCGVQEEIHSRKVPHSSSQSGVSLVTPLSRDLFRPTSEIASTHLLPATRIV